jgi:hypothetical protein
MPVDDGDLGRDALLDKVMGDHVADRIDRAAADPREEGMDVGIHPPEGLLEGRPLGLGEAPVHQRTFRA